MPQLYLWHVAAFLFLLVDDRPLVEVNKMMFALAQSDRGEESDEVALIGFSSDSWEGHFVSGDVLAGIGEIREQMLFAPGDSRVLHGLAIGEESLSCFSANDSAQRGCSSSLTVSLCYHSQYLETVASGAELIKDALSNFDVSCGDIHIRFLDSSFLFGWHSVK